MKAIPMNATKTVNSQWVLWNRIVRMFKDFIRRIVDFFKDFFNIA